MSAFYMFTMHFGVCHIYIYSHLCIYAAWTEYLHLEANIRHSDDEMKMLKMGFLRSFLTWTREFFGKYLPFSVWSDWYMVGKYISRVLVKRKHKYSWQIKQFYICWKVVGAQEILWLIILENDGKGRIMVMLKLFTIETAKTERRWRRMMVQLN